MSELLQEEQEEELTSGPAMMDPHTWSFCMSQVDVHVGHDHSYQENYAHRVGQRLFIVDAP